LSTIFSIWFNIEIRKVWQGGILMMKRTKMISFIIGVLILVFIVSTRLKPHITAGEEDYPEWEINQTKDLY